MIRTLQFYLARDLLRATLLAALALTVVLTIFSVLEPLREYGLSGGRVVMLFGYLVPAMFAFTLPFAALFGTTIVYGRFAQDNELMACRASGIATLSVLKPALWLALVVSVVTELMVLHIAPSLLGRLEYAIKANIRQIAFHSLQSRQYYKAGGRIYHADHANPKDGWIHGGIAIEPGDKGEISCVVASSALLDFSERGGKTVVTLYPTNPVWFDGRNVVKNPVQGLESTEIPGLEDEPRFYGWDQLWQTWTHTASSPAVAEEVEKIRRQMVIEAFYNHLVAGILADRRYALLELSGSETESDLRRIEILADQARLVDDKEVVVGSPLPPDPEKPDRKVIVREYSGQSLRREHFAHQVRVTGYTDTLTARTMAGVLLVDVLSRSTEPVGPPPPSRLEYNIGSFGVPPEAVARAGQVSAETLFTDQGKQNLSRRVRQMVDNLEQHVLVGLERKVRAEMHIRLAYGVSCFLLVVMGGALGLMFRGGQFLAALAIVAVPGFFVTMMLYMGREMVRNPGVPEALGISATWCGVAMLTLAAAYVYAVPMRR